MYNISEVSKVNGKYIFFGFSDNTQDRRIINKNDLRELHSDICDKLKSYDFMKEKCKKVEKSLIIEREKLSNIIERYEKYISEHKEEPSIRRGCDSICWNLESTKKNQRELNLQISGVNKTWSYASAEYWKIYRLKEQTEAAIRLMK